MKKLLSFAKMADLLRRTPSPTVRAAYRRGNAAGVHGARKYGKAERQQSRRDERRTNAHGDAG